MSGRRPTELGRAVRRFFEEYLTHLRGLSTHTVKSYRDALVLFLRFASHDARRTIERLEIADLDRSRVIRFLDHLETVRGNGVATRNARLAALHTFARFLVAERRSGDPPDLQRPAAPRGLRGRWRSGCRSGAAEPETSASDPPKRHHRQVSCVPCAPAHAGVATGKPRVTPSTGARPHQRVLANPGNRGFIRSSRSFVAGRNGQPSVQISPAVIGDIDATSFTTDRLRSPSIPTPHHTVGSEDSRAP